MKVPMRSLVIAMILTMCGVAVAQPEPAAPPAPAPPPPPALACKLAEPPPPRDPDKQPDPDEARYESEHRQYCEDELSKDREWWFTLEERLGRRVHRQAAREITTNNRHVIGAYAAMWLLAVAFVVMLWRRQQALKAEIERLSSELKKAEGS
jgi:hypothetical protein